MIIRKQEQGEQTELFLNTLESVGEKVGIRITPIQYVKAYKICIEDLKFGYPAEYKVSELISTDETYEQTLVIMTTIMKRFRLEFYKSIKRNYARTKKRVAA